MIKKRELSDDILEIEGATPSEVVKLLGRFKVGEYWEEGFRIQEGKDLNDTNEMMRYINSLKSAGLDIGKGDAAFGYKMPLPRKDQSYRYLQIFRRN